MWRHEPQRSLSSLDRVPTQGHLPTDWSHIITYSWSSDVQGIFGIESFTFRLSPCFLLFPRSPLSLALISNKDEGVALIDIVANESFSSVSLTSTIPGQCISPRVLLPAGFSLFRPTGIVVSLLLLLPTGKCQMFFSALVVPRAQSPR